LFWAQRRFESQGFNTMLEVSWGLTEHLQIVSGLEHTVDREEPMTATRLSKLELAGVPRGSVLPGSEGTAPHEVLQNFGALTQVHFTPHPQIAATGGFRYDHHSIYGGQPSGRATLVLSPIDALHLKFIAGTAFKAPSPALLYEQPLVAGGVLGNPKLAPQRLSSGEVQALYRFSPHLSLTSGLSYSVLTDKAQFTRIGVNQEARNLAAVKAWSWETRMEAKPSRGLLLSTSWERVWAHQVQDEVGYKKALFADDTSIYPAYIFRADAQLRLPSLPLALNAYSMLVTERAASNDNTLEAGERYGLPAYLLMDFGVSTVGLQWAGYRETSASLSVRNALDTKAADPGFAGIDYPLTSRTLHLQLRQEL
jgi:iron complex outermembrane receptor protein